MAYVTAEGKVFDEYEVATFFVDEHTAKPAIPVICIAELQQKLLVAVPHQVWHRTPSKRVLPSAFFSKPTVVEVKVCKVTARTTQLEDYIKVWIGFLHDDHREGLHYAENSEFDYFFGPSPSEEVGPVIPMAQALVEVAQEHFAFFSATEQGTDKEEKDEVELAADVGSQDHGDRLTKLEHTMEKLAAAIEMMASPRRPSALKKGQTDPAMRVEFADVAAGAMSSSSTTRRPTSKAKAMSGQKGLETMYPHLDAGVVQAALQANVPVTQLEQMEKMMASNVKAKKVKDMNPQVALDPLSEADPLDEDEGPEEEQEGAGSQDGLDPVSRSLVKLTGIMELLASDKKKGPGSKLDQALDAVGSSGADGMQLGSGKKSASARRLLRTTFAENPSEISQVVERLMFEDLQSQTLGPGLQMTGLNARAWVEFRSKIGAFRSTAHSAWSMAGVLDSLIAGNIARARCIAGLHLLQIDQASIDHGNWSFASELSLEQLPPFAALSQHLPPSVQLGEQPFSRLLDSRWSDIMIGFLKDQDDFITRRKTIGKPSKVKDETDGATEEPWRRRKPKAKAKAAGAAGESTAWWMAVRHQTADLCMVQMMLTVPHGLIPLEQRHRLKGLDLS